MRFPLAALALLFAASVRADGPDPRALLDAVEKQLKAVHETAGPCVACIAVSRSALYPKPANPPEHAGKLGDFTPAAFLKDNPDRAKLAAHLDLSDAKTIAEHGYTGGVVVDAAGLVLTTFQPLDGATKIYVHLPGGKGSYADIHAADTRADLAVLKLLAPPQGLKAITLGDARLADTSDGKKATVFAGKLVVLMTNPLVTGFALDRPSAGLGTISNLRRLDHPLKENDSGRSVYAHGTFLEHDAKLFAGAGRRAGAVPTFDEPETKANAGISGAALLNLDGELIGITTQGHALAKAEYGPGFAFPVTANLRRIIDVLKRGEEVEYGYLGVQFPRGFGPGFPPPAFGRGLHIPGVAPDGPAWLAGLRANHVVTRIDGVPVANYGDLVYLASSALAGSRVQLTIGTEPNARELSVTLGKIRNDEPVIASLRPEPVFGLRVDYGSVMAQTVVNNARFETAGIPPGVCVRELVADSPAAAKFKTLGDVPTRWLITHVDGVAVTTPAEFHKAAKGRAAVKLTLLDPSAEASRRELTIP